MYYGQQLCNKNTQKSAFGNKKVKYYLSKTEQKQAVGEQVKLDLLSDTESFKYIA
jgi:hypothetical protein